MTDLIVVPHTNQWHKLKALVLDSVSSPITKRVYNLGLDEFFAWYGQEARSGFTKATVSAWRVSLEARGLGSISINVQITAVRKLAVEAADNGLLAAELAAGITRIKGVKMKGVRVGTRAYRLQKWVSPSSPTLGPRRFPMPSSAEPRCACRDLGGAWHTC